MAFTAHRGALPVRHCKGHGDNSAVPGSWSRLPCSMKTMRTMQQRFLMVHSSLDPAGGSRGAATGHKQRTGSSSSSSSSLSFVHMLHTAEFSAISIAAVCQAAILALTAVCQWQHTQQVSGLQEVSHSVGTTSQPRAPAKVPAQQQQKQQQQYQVHSVQPLSLSQPTAALHLVTTSALVVGLLCGAALRQLQQRPQQGLGSLKPAADAAVRLAALELNSQQTAAHLTAATRQIDKLQARVRLATSDLKQPIKAAQGAAAQQSAALLKLSQQHSVLQQQVDGSQELIAALQALAAKQLQVSIEALQQLKQGQAQLGGRTSKAVTELQHQQQALQQQVKQHQQQLEGLQRAADRLQQQQYRLGMQQTSDQPLSPSEGSIGSDHAAGKAGSMSHTHPDPWQVASHATGTQNNNNKNNNSNNSRQQSGKDISGVAEGHNHHESCSKAGAAESLSSPLGPFVAQHRSSRGQSLNNGSQMPCV